MISLNFNGKGFDRCPTPIPVGQYLPGPAVILHRTPFISLLVKWDDFWSACRQLTSEIAPGQYIYFDASWDPFTLSNEEITQRLEQAREIFIGHKVSA